jgi:hypothetical protein
VAPIDYPPPQAQSATVVVWLRRGNPPAAKPLHNALAGFSIVSFVHAISKMAFNNLPVKSKPADEQQRDKNDQDYSDAALARA